MLCLLHWYIHVHTEYGHKANKIDVHMCKKGLMFNLLKFKTVVSNDTAVVNEYENLESSSVVQNVDF